MLPDSKRTHGVRRYVALLLWALVIFSSSTSVNIRRVDSVTGTLMGSTRSLVA